MSKKQTQEQTETDEPRGEWLAIDNPTRTAEWAREVDEDTILEEFESVLRLWRQCWSWGDNPPDPQPKIDRRHCERILFQLLAELVSRPQKGPS